MTRDHRCAIPVCQCGFVEVEDQADFDADSEAFGPRKHGRRYRSSASCHLSFEGRQRAHEQAADVMRHGSTQTCVTVRQLRDFVDSLFYEDRSADERRFQDSWVGGCRIFGQKQSQPVQVARLRLDSVQAKYVHEVLFCQ